MVDHHDVQRPGRAVGWEAIIAPAVAQDIPQLLVLDQRVHHIGLEDVYVHWAQRRNIGHDGQDGTNQHAAKMDAKVSRESTAHGTRGPMQSREIRENWSLTSKNTVVLSDPLLYLKIEPPAENGDVEMGRNEEEN